MPCVAFHCHFWFNQESGMFCVKAHCTAFSWFPRTVAVPHCTLVANAGLAPQTTEGRQQAHPSERHVRHSSCPSIIDYIAEALWGRRRLPKPKLRHNALSFWSKNAPETRRHVRHEPKNYVSWHDLIPPCQAKARSQKKHAKARKARRAALRESTRPEASCMSDALFLWFVQRLAFAGTSQVQSVPYWPDPKSKTERYTAIHASTPTEFSISIQFQLLDCSMFHAMKQREQERWQPKPHRVIRRLRKEEQFVI